MALIRIVCSACQTALQVRAEAAGQQVKCPKCGAAIAVEAAAGESGSKPSVAAAVQSPQSPSDQPARAAGSAAASTAPPTTPLAQAMAPDMLAEISRRKKSAVMVVFETPPDGSYDLSRRPEANVRCYRTPDMTDGQLMEVLEQIGHMSKGQRNQKGGIGLQPDGQPVPYELKGDRLGMTLEEFKTKYARKIGGMTMPYCADSCPGQANESLWAEPWHVGAGLINARIDLPSESNPPTIAGVKTERFVYHFVDGKLFRMTALFDTEAFHLIHNALVQKQGPAARENKEPLELTWENGVSTIKLTRGLMRPKKASSLVFIHNELQKSTEGRAPKRSADL